MYTHEKNEIRDRPYVNYLHDKSVYDFFYNFRPSGLGPLFFYGHLSRSSASIAAS